MVLWFVCDSVLGEHSSDSVQSEHSKDVSSVIRSRMGNSVLCMFVRRNHHMSIWISCVMSSTAVSGVRSQIPEDSRAVETFARHSGIS